MRSDLRSQRFGFSAIPSFLLFRLDSTIAIQHYIDPATTAMVTQIIAGIVISVGVAVGLFWRRIVLFFQNLRIKQTQRSIEKQTDRNH